MNDRTPIFRVLWLLVTVIFWGCTGADTSSSGPRDGQIIDSFADAGPLSPDQMQTDVALNADAAFVQDAFQKDLAVDDMRTADVGDATLWQPSGEPDLVLNLEDLKSDIWFDEIYVAPDSCVYQENCVDGVGVRRLMRFSVATGNVGATDYLLGDPAQLNDEVVFSPCHNHYHYTDYANYELRQGDRLVRQGHKQAFCLMDIRPMSGVDPTAIRPRARYNCRYQGISAGWEDVYGSHLDCQWIDITNLSPGTYTLGVQINPQHVIKESRFDNNDGQVEVVIPNLDPTQPCSADVPPGLKRHCDWEQRTTVRCEPNHLLRVGGGGCYDLGNCTGSPVLRLCDGGADSCSASLALSESDSGCGESMCPYAETLCPPSGRVDVWVNHADPSIDRIVVESTDEIARLDKPCVGGRPRGLSRLCGWSDQVTTFTCVPHRQYRVGCDVTAIGCDKELRCTGDPMLRVCENTDRCTQSQGIAESDDACGSRCPMTDFTCPAAGEIRVIRASFDAEDDFSCNLTMVMQ